NGEELRRQHRAQRGFVAGERCAPGRLAHREDVRIDRLGGVERERESSERNQRKKTAHRKNSPCILNNTPCCRSVRGTIVPSASTAPPPLSVRRVPGAPWLASR